MAKIICNTKFKLDAFADGGSKRSVQIREWLTDNQFSWEDDDFALPKHLSKLDLLVLACRAILFIRKYYDARIGKIAQYVNLIKYFALRIPIVYDKYKNRDVVFLWENTNDRNMLYLMKATGHPVIAMPHNLESLVSSRSVMALEGEVENLKHCDMVFTIAKEETWLLRLLGINAHYFPYYPPKEVEKYFLEIRKQREKREKNVCSKYLLLGSATNPPTRAGMQQLIDVMGAKELPFNLIIAGYNTEVLTIGMNQNITLLGTLSNGDLQALLLTIDALLIYQPPTTGSLTRIPEMFTAGIPIYANFDASRNNFNIKGVTTYSSLEQLYDLLTQSSSFNILGAEQDSQWLENCYKELSQYVKKKL